MFRFVSISNRPEEVYRRRCSPADHQHAQDLYQLLRRANPIIVVLGERCFGLNTPETFDVLVREEKTASVEGREQEWGHVSTTRDVDNTGDRAYQRGQCLLRLAVTIRCVVWHHTANAPLACVVLVL